MRCAWQAFINLLPVWMREEADRKGSQECQELRLRIQQPPEMIFQKDRYEFHKLTTKEDISYIINTASRYSPWAAATISSGYIAAQGGHRIGICGQAVWKDGVVCGIREPSSLCVRVARDFPGIAGNMPRTGSILIIGSPGSGKTTLLRDLIRFRAREYGAVSVVDERGEIFPIWNGSPCFSLEHGIDIMTGVEKAQGLDMTLRTMGPKCIAVDEITSQTDAQALSQAAWCGVELLATAHAGSVQDLYRRPVYQSIATAGIFQYIITVNRDNSCRLERMEQ